MNDVEALNDIEEIKEILNRYTLNDKLSILRDIEKQINPNPQ